MWTHDLRPHRSKDAPVLGVPPDQDRPFGRRPEPDAGDGVPTSRTLLCPHCTAGPGDDHARTIAASGNCLTLTWYHRSCPHHAADRVLAGEGE